MNTNHLGYWKKALSVVALCAMSASCDEAPLAPDAGGFSPASWVAMIDGYTQAAAQTRLAVPILYGVDALHGNNKATGAVIFPHNIGLGCTRDPALVQEAARITALEVAAMGATWTFGPMVSVSFDDRWGREYE